MGVDNGSIEREIGFILASIENLNDTLKELTKKLDDKPSLERCSTHITTIDKKFADVKIQIDEINKKINELENTLIELKTKQTPNTSSQSTKQKTKINWKTDYITILLQLLTHPTALTIFVLITILGILIELSLNKPIFYIVISNLKSLFK